MLLWVVRGGFVALALVVAGFAFAVAARDFNNPALGVAACLAVCLVAGGLIFADVRQTEKRIATASAVFFGLVGGLLAGWLVSLAVDALVAAAFTDLKADPTAAADRAAVAYKVSAVLRALAMLVGAFVAVTLLVQTRDDFSRVDPLCRIHQTGEGRAADGAGHERNH